MDTEVQPIHRVLASAPRLVAIASVVLATSVVFYIGSSSIRSVVLAGFALVSVVAISAGIRKFKPADSTSWWCLFGAAAMFLIGVGLRGDPTVYPVGVTALSNALTLSGYTLIGTALARWILERRSRDDLTPLIDAGLIALGGLFLSWVWLISPLLNSNIATVVAIMNGIYPAIDAGMITLILYLLISSGRRNRSLRLLLVTLVSILVGDVAYAFFLSRDSPISPGLLDGIYILAYASLALAALDPHMATMANRQRAAPQHRRRRVAFVMVMLAVCAAILVLGSAASTADLVVRSSLLSAILVGSFLRGERAMGLMERSEDDARYRAAHDALTGLPNRTMLPYQFGRLASTDTAGRIFILFVDLDNFKMVNDSYGHRVGDEMIAAAAHRIRATVRPSDTVVRYAGDEFIVIGRCTGPEIDDLVRSLIDRIAEPFILSAASTYITASIGIAATESRSRVLDDLIREADTAMYHAKSQGASRYAYFDESLRASSTAAIETATALRGAVRRGELEVHYQPIVMTSSRETVVYEALVRWNYGGRLRNPGEFVGIAESTNLIGEIGNEVLRIALRDLAVLREAGQEVTMSVNISPIQLRDDSLPGIVAELLRESGLRGADLALEVTETALIDDVFAAKDILDRLAAMDVLIVLDDFGVGYSSLSRLRELPIALLKIDRSFISEIGRSEGGDSLVTAITAMARALPVSIVAEGVETEQQARAIEALHCRFAQGYLYGRPAPLDHWLELGAQSTALR
ncbi:bifunctional diguanylate cyclase/phosphodiesterase [Rhodococcus sp. G-MC3]|uniref:putative bifunctional diguanylate cyclase/phosphodiesterase n=1 Tax=Rhodococcus sp. G-MC3 TaxID=3046209 RepID=UPI0024BB72DB|nr:bifunctional diguanylate cyclase/phosphodiesterase [Rhodococcus sp. G-MC3]MDJ0393676.1 bifunctional diguanylate cyclase/phosphodiesterase [Rhodococcus sp. G-MC3]